MFSTQLINNTNKNVLSRGLHTWQDASFGNVDISGYLKIYNDISFIKLDDKDIPNKKQIKEHTSGFSSGGSGGGGGGRNWNGSNSQIVNDVSQTFFEIMTEQPYRFDISNVVETTSKVTINWYYDRIVSKNYYNNMLSSVLAFQSNQKLKMLPYINEIQIEISGNTGPYTSTNRTWIKLDMEYNSANNNKYTTYNLYEFTKHTTTVNSDIQYILSELDNFDVRIYGINNAIDYPSVDDRALYFYNINFLKPKPPSIPEFNSIIPVASNSQIQFKYKCNETENKTHSDDDESDAVITSAKINYREVDTLAYNNSITDTSYNSTNSGYNATENEEFVLALNNLRSGTLYKYKVSARNDLTEIYSDYSDYTTHSNDGFNAYTRLPDNTSINTSLDFSINSSSKTDIRSYEDSNVSNEIYINLVNGNAITPYNINSQYFQISKPYTVDQQITQYGYGKYIEGSLNLVQVEVKVGTTVKQLVSYGGFNTDPSDTISTNFISNISQQDIYTNNDNKKGVRLKGELKLKTIINSNIQEFIGPASSDLYELKYDYTRNTDVNSGTQNPVTHNIYIDSLSENPTIINDLNTVRVTDVKYTMGIASVYTMEIIINRTYNNCNSIHGYIPGNGIIGNISAISKTNFGTNNKIISSGSTSIDITTPGQYTHNRTVNSVVYYSNTSNFSTNSGKNDSLIVTTTAYNLVGNTTNNISLVTTGDLTTLKHFYDINSYPVNNPSTSKLNLSNIYEIDNIALLGSNMGGIIPVKYTNHTQIVKPWTLLYINGAWQTNASFTYPNTSQYNYDSLPIDTYSAGTTAYDLTGVSNSNGYKWIVFKFDKNSDITTVSTTAGNIEYLNLHNKFSNHPYNFTTSILTKLKKINYETTDDVLGFIQQDYTVAGITTHCIGNLSKPFNSDNNWYIFSANASFNEIFFTGDASLKGKYGCFREDGDDWGPIVQTDTAAGDLYVFIGFRNL